MLSVKGAMKEPAGGARAVVRLTRVTALLAGPAVELHGARAAETRSPGLVPVEVEADRCLFAAVPGAGRPLVEVDAVDPADVDRVLGWKRGMPNRYANFDGPVAVVRPADDSAAKTWDWNQWVMFAHEVGRPVGTVTFAAGPAAVRDLATLKPADAAVKEIDFPQTADAQKGDAGAEVERVAAPAAGPAGGGREPPEPKPDESERPG